MQGGLMCDILTVWCLQRSTGYGLSSMPLADRKAARLTVISLLI